MALRIIIALWLLSGIASAQLNISQPAFVAGVLKPASGGGGGGIAVDAITIPTGQLSGANNISHTTSGSDRYMLVVFSNNGNTTVATAPTYNGSAMTKLITQAPPGSFGRTEIWGLLAPSVGTFNVVLALPSNYRVGVYTLTGVNQSTPIGTAVSANGTSTTPSVTVTTASGEFVVDVAAVNDGDTQSCTVGANQTERWNQPDTGQLRSMSSTQAGADGGVMSWTLGGSLEWSICAVPLKPL